MFAGGGVEQQNRILAETGNVVVVAVCAAGEHRTGFIGEENVAEFFPVNEVFGNGVSPGHVAPVDAVRIVLIEHMILAVHEDQTVRVVVPADAGGEVRRRTEVRAIRNFAHFRETVTFLIRDHIAVIVGERQLSVAETGDVGIRFKARIFEIEGCVKVVDQRPVFGHQTIVLFRERIVDRSH